MSSVPVHATKHVKRFIVDLRHVAISRYDPCRSNCDKNDHQDQRGVLSKTNYIQVWKTNRLGALQFQCQSTHSTTFTAFTGRLLLSQVDYHVNRGVSQHCHRVDSKAIHESWHRFQKRCYGRNHRQKQIHRHPNDGCQMPIDFLGRDGR